MTPQAIIVTDDTLFVADQGNHAIRKVDLSSFPAVVTTFAGGLLPGNYGGYVDATGTDARFHLSQRVGFTGHQTLRC